MIQNEQQQKQVEVIPFFFFALVYALAFSTSAAAFFARKFSFFSSISSVYNDTWQR